MDSRENQGLRVNQGLKGTDSPENQGLRGADQREPWAEEDES